MSREATFQRNMKIANDLRAVTGTTSKAIAMARCFHCGVNHKFELDRMILEYNWSSAVMINEFTKKFPECAKMGVFPSERALDNYKSKLHRSGSHIKQIMGVTGIKVIDEMKATLLKEFDPIYEGIVAYRQLSDRVRRGITFERKAGSIPAQAVTDAAKERTKAYEALVEAMKKLGFGVPEAPVFQNPVFNIQQNKYGSEPSRVTGTTERSREIAALVIAAARNGGIIPSIDATGATGSEGEPVTVVEKPSE